MKQSIIFAVGLCLASTWARAEETNLPPMADGPFKPSWESLENHYRCPEWFRDAKFGIFMHWSVNTVAEHNGWYGTHMYNPKEECYRYHCKTFGHPSKFGYKDLIPLWKAEKWNPESLIQYYKSIGAKYIVPVAVHHDGFDNYKSTYQPWNSVNMGPRRDIVGEWAALCRKHGLRLGVASHLDVNPGWLGGPSRGADKEGPFKRVRYDGVLTKADGKGTWWEGYDPADFYVDPKISPTQWSQRWYLRTAELVDKYQPDLLYFDLPWGQGIDGMPFAKVNDSGFRLVAHYLNQNLSAHGGKQEAVLAIKTSHDRAATKDFECGMSATLRDQPWQTDTTVNPGWFYQKASADSQKEAAGRVISLTPTVAIHNLCDIVSKNGNLLLNVGLRSDGTLPDEQRAVLDAIGQWLTINGEAIFGTRPWGVFGEGPTVIKEGKFKERTKSMTPQDIRFTTRGATLYAIVLGWPKDSVARIASLASNKGTTITQVHLLGCKTAVSWEQVAEGLVVKLPQTKPCDHAIVLKIEHR